MTNLTAKTIAGRNWENFVVDSIPLDVANTVVTGKKKFSGTVTINKNDSSLAFMNTRNISSDYASTAFIDESTVFSGTNEVGANISVIILEKINASSSLKLNNSNVGNTNLEWLYLNTVGKETGIFDITGKLEFSENLDLD